MNPRERDETGGDDEDSPQRTQRNAEDWWDAIRKAKPLRDRAKITSHCPAGSFGRQLRCSLLTDPLAGYARPSRLAGGQNSCAVKHEFIFARSLIPKQHHRSACGPSRSSWPDRRHLVGSLCYHCSGRPTRTQYHAGRRFAPQAPVEGAGGTPAVRRPGYYLYVLTQRFSL